MTTYSIDKISGGLWSGSNASPSSGTSGTFTTNGNDRKILVICVAGRSLNGGNSGDYHHVASLSATGLTFTRILSSEFHYTDAGSGAFPDAWYTLDVFLADAPTQVTNLAWSATMEAANDTFVNDGWCSIYNIDGAFDLDGNASNLTVASHLTNSASTLTSGPLTTDDANPLVILLLFGHDRPIEAISLPSGFSSTFSGAGGNGQFDTGGAAATQANVAMVYQEYASARSAETFTCGTQHIDWFSAAIAFASAPPATLPPRSAATVVM